MPKTVEPRNIHKRNTTPHDRQGEKLVSEQAVNGAEPAMEHRSAHVHIHGDAAVGSPHSQRWRNRSLRPPCHRRYRLEILRLAATLCAKIRSRCGTMGGRRRSRGVSDIASRVELFSAPGYVRPVHDETDEVAGAATSSNRQTRQNSAQTLEPRHSPHTVRRRAHCAASHGPSMSRQR